jgi:hypothetical protein
MRQLSKMPTRRARVGRGRFLCERRSGCDLGDSAPRPLTGHGGVSNKLRADRIGSALGRGASRRSSRTSFVLAHPS